MEKTITQTSNGITITKGYTREEILGAISILEDELLETIYNISESIGYTKKHEGKYLQFEDIQKIQEELLIQAKSAFFDSNKNWNLLKTLMIIYGILSVAMICEGIVKKALSFSPVVFFNFVAAFLSVVSTRKVMNADKNYLLLVAKKGFVNTYNIDSQHYANIETLVAAGEMELAVEYYLNMKKMTVLDPTTQQETNSFVLGLRQKQE